jgi:hypothetical protein
MKNYYAFVNYLSNILAVKIKAGDSNQAYFSLVNRGYEPLTGCYDCPNNAIWSFNCALPLPDLTWKEVR